MLMVSYSDGGLSNRLMPLLSTMVIASHVGTTPAVYWPPSPVCDCSFLDLFEPTLKVLTLQEFVDTKREAMVFQKKENLPVNPLRISPVQLPAVNRDVVFMTSDFVCRQNEPVPVFIREVAAAFRSLAFSQEVEIKSAFPVGDCVGLSIRTTDLYLTRLVDFYEAIDSILANKPDQSFFLSSDSQLVYHELKSRYGARIRYRQRAFAKKIDSSLGWSKNMHCDKDTVVDALVDLLILAQTRRTLGSHASSFPVLLSFISDCRVEILNATSAGLL